MDELRVIDELTRNFSDMEMEQLYKISLEAASLFSLNEKIQVTHDYMKLSNTWSNWSRNFLKSSKSAAKAAELRVRGNVAFQSQKYSDALKLYTESIAVAPVGSQELAYAYANRSAVLMKMEKHLECLLDINRAIEEDYPEVRKQKLIDRRNKNIAFLRNAINRYISSPGDIWPFSGITNLEQFVAGFSPEMRDLSYQSTVPEVNFKNKLIPNASHKIKMMNTQDGKMGIVATANIQPGEIIVIEKPVAWNLFFENTHSHCANCFRRCDALIHCPNCSSVMFCSAHCRDKAYALFHRIECQIFSKLPADMANKLLKSWIHVRVLLVITKQGEELDQIMNHPAYKLPLAESFSHDVKKVFNSQEFSSVLAHGKSTCDNKFEDFHTKFKLPLFRSIMTVVYNLRHSTFFGNQFRGNQNLDNPLTNQELYVANLLLKLSQNTCYSFKEESRGVIDVKAELTKPPVGHGLFPLLNVFKHSCDPQVKSFICENSVVCCAIRPIKVGDEIFSGRFPPYSISPRSERIANLKERFNFECTCEPCLYDWPTINMLPFDSQKVVSDDIEAEKFEEYSSRFKKLSESYDYKKVATSENFEFLREYSSMLHSRVDKPCRVLIDCEGFLAFNMLSGRNFA